MSKLKAIESSTAVIGNVNLVYIKSDADRYINWLKYKRCLAMAGWSRALRGYFSKKLEFGLEPKSEARAQRRVIRFHKWRNKWLKLADKFKEAK